jgi:dTMP kinase
LLDAPLEVGLRRIGERKPDHFEREQRPFFERVRAAYLALAAQYPERIKIVDAALPLPQVQRQIEAEIAALVERFGLARR